ncbi:MAG: glycoside-pentoside-hexuronide (GPH):cation symporter [Anaerolineales bacterium]|nr:glycoside-pentoside-hexuronide (GPH):cation symporter [Anaerolineales bacterium]MCS7247478.1 glycoside-pentoside-hexuronide (GPH):cation symporter [Anaerolineales bacterium]MDW8161289.1 glycoside-pentoside-hexuronide (GPH):cation symporter [Anaerolineales bacterium]MDW8446409.1 glycoside-pentoside-hexuronide (GPH):cation symporter [Anaerolineales bacterium]
MSASLIPLRKLTLWQKLLYGSGDWSLSSFTTIRALLYTIFLTDVVRLDPGLASVSALVGTAWDAINDPLVGALNDRVRSRWGRRRPFLLLFAIPFGLGFLLLWWVPPTESQALKMIYVTLAFILTDTLHTLVNVPYLALVPDISRDYDERTSLSGFRVLFNLLATLVTAVAAPTIVDEVVRSGASPQQGYLLVAGLFGGLAILPFLVIPVLIKETKTDLDVPEKINLRKMWAVIVRNRPFLYVTGLYSLTWIAFDLVSRMLPFFAVYWVGEGNSLIGRQLLGQDFALESLAMGGLMIISLVSIPLWITLSGRLGKKAAYLIGMVFWIIVLSALLFVQPGQVSLTLALSALAGLSVSAASILPESMLPDAVDWDEYQSGERNEGLYFGAITLFRKFSSAVAGFLALQALNLFGYQAPPEGVTVWQQSPPALTAIRWMTGPFSALLVLAAVIVAWKYPLTRQQYERIRAALAAHRDSTAALQTTSPE